MKRSNEDDDGFTPVVRRASKRGGGADRPYPRPAPGNLSFRGTSSYRGTGPMSRSRQSNVNPRPYMKEEFLPKSQQNPDRLLQQQLQRHDKDRFRVGSLVLGPFHEQDRTVPGQTTAPPKSNITDSNFGKIFSKFRPMLVVGLYQDHYVVIPLFTHGGKGLGPQYDHKDWVSVKDHRSTQFEQQTTYRPLVTGHFNGPVPHMHPRSAAHITAPYSRSYDLPCLIQGVLTEASTRDLQEYYQSRAPKGPPKAPAR